MANARPERVETGAKGKCGHGKYACLRAAEAQRRSGRSRPGQSGEASRRIARTSPSRSTTEWRRWAAALNLLTYLMYVSIARRRLSCEVKREHGVVASGVTAFVNAYCAS